MRKLLYALLLLSVQATAQPKPAKKEKPPSQKELADMMKEAQQAMDELSPEDKRMMDSLGVKLPNLQRLQKTASFAAANAHKSGGDVLVPARDAARIVALPRTPLNRATLPGYLQAIDASLQAKLSKENVELANRLSDAVRMKEQAPRALANAAAGCLAFGRPQAGLLLMSRACLLDPGDDQTLNNLAALLSMNGGEHLALPLLQFLNRQYPRNSTILNNLAHAWFGLGDVENAVKYIDSTLRLCAWHPQANQIKAAIAESKGDKAGAVAALKAAISRAYSGEKEDALKRLNYGLTGKDLNWKSTLLQDPLSLSTFSIPPYPVSLDECLIVEPVWEGYREQVEQRMAEVNAELQAAADQWQKFLPKMVSATPASTAALGPALPPLSAFKAAIVLPFPLTSPQAELAQARFQELLNSSKTIDSISAPFDAREQELNAKYADQFGEGKPNPFAEACADYSSNRNQYLRAVNPYLERLHLSYLKVLRQYLYDQLYYFHNTQPPLQFAATLADIKRQWLTGLLSMSPQYRSYWDVICLNKAKPQPGRTKPLAQFTDVNCQYKSELNLWVGTITQECDKLTAHLEVLKPMETISPFFLNVEWQTKSADREENRNFLDEFQRSTVEFGASESKKFGKGPLQLEVSGTASGFVEIDRSGIKDLGVKGNLDASVKTNVVDNKVETDVGEVGVGPGNKSVSLGGVDAVISINGGFTGSGSGLLRGLKF